MIEENTKDISHLGSKETFEQTIKQLETIVAELEKGESNLEDSIAKFERGLNLVQSCQKVLESAKQKVHVLLDKKLKNFSDGSGNSEKMEG